MHAGKMLRSFVLAHLAGAGFLVLPSPKGFGKLPGGRADPADQVQASAYVSEFPESLDESNSMPSLEIDGVNLPPAVTVDYPLEKMDLITSKVTAARELFEETGIDVRQNLDVLVSLAPWNVNSKNRRFFYLDLTQGMFENLKESATRDGNSHLLKRGSKYVSNNKMPQSSSEIRRDMSDVLLLLSDECTDFYFVKDLQQCAADVKHHSSGHCYTALMKLANISKENV